MSMQLCVLPEADKKAVGEQYSLAEGWRAFYRGGSGTFLKVWPEYHKWTCILWIWRASWETWRCVRGDRFTEKHISQSQSPSQHHRACQAYIRERCHTRAWGSIRHCINIPERPWWKWISWADQITLWDPVLRGHQGFCRSCQKVRATRCHDSCWQGHARG